VPVAQSERLLRYTKIGMLFTATAFLAIGLVAAWRERNSSALLAVGVVLGVLVLVADRATSVVANLFGQEVAITLDPEDLEEKASSTQQLIDKVEEVIAMVTADPQLDPELRTLLEGLEVQLEELHSETRETVEAVQDLATHVPPPAPPDEVVRTLEIPDRIASFELLSGDRQIIMRPVDDRDSELRCVVVDPVGRQHDAVARRSSFLDRPAFVSTSQETSRRSVVRCQATVCTTSPGCAAPTNGRSPRRAGRLAPKPTTKTRRRPHDNLQSVLDATIPCAALSVRLNSLAGVV
jgi:hypothetical protein